MTSLLTSRLAAVIGVTSFAGFLLARWYLAEPVGVLDVIEAIVFGVFIPVVIYAIVRIIDRNDWVAPRDGRR